jgi:hypothetical protein
MMVLRSGFARCAALAVLVLAGKTGAWDLSLGVQRDVLYRPPEDSSYAPAVVTLGADFALGGLGHIRARVGYSRYWNWYVADDDPSQWDNTFGYRVQAVPFIRIPTPLKPLSVSVGLGLGGRGQKDATWVENPPLYYNYTVVHDRVTWAIDQSFVAGLQLDVSRRFAVDLEAERAGVTLAWTVLRKYYTAPGVPKYVSLREDVYHIGWVEGALTGLGMGLRLKL